MKELFREKDFTRVAFYQSLLEAEGIPTFVRNQNLAMSGLSEIPIPEFYPALCVVDDGDYPVAVEIIRKNLAEVPAGLDEEIPCPTCGEMNPGNFEMCWSCNGPVRPESN